MSYLPYVLLGMLAGIVVSHFFKVKMIAFLSLGVIALGVMVGMGRHLDGLTHTIGIVLIVVFIQVGYFVGLALKK